MRYCRRVNSDTDSWQGQLGSTGFVSESAPERGGPIVFQSDSAASGANGNSSLDTSWRKPRLRVKNFFNLVFPDHVRTRSKSS